MNKKTTSPQSVKQRLFLIIFRSDTPAGKAFDVVLLIVILLSILAVMLESVKSIVQEYGPFIRTFEWVITILFTLEYFLRIYCARNRKGYILSFYGLVDFISIIPTYLSLIVVGTQYILVVRALRLLRVFRVLKLYHFLGEAQVLGSALRQSAAKITVFLGTVVTLIFIVGSMMYLIEGPEHGFTSIPISIYWAIVTLTTVGYGDIAPQTIAGQMLASIVMIMGYGIIAVPTGIVSVELSKADIKNKRSRVSLNASSEQFCKPQEIKWDKIQQKAK